MCQTVLAVALIKEIQSLAWGASSLLKQLFKYQDFLGKKSRNFSFYFSLYIFGLFIKPPPNCK